MRTFNVEEYFHHDHDELDKFLKDFQLLKTKDFEAAKESFKRFKFGLQRHIAWEEQILFPLFEDVTGMKDAGPTVVMRQEHRQIEAALEAIHKKVQRRDPDSRQEEADLVAVLQAHNEKEETILYPAIDQMVSDKERLAAYERMKTMPQETYKTCCCHMHLDK